MDKIRDTINNVIEEIQEQEAYRPVALNESLRIVNDLGFKSLDVAQLIASLELELGIDPFAQGVSIKDVVTIGDLCKVYHDCLENNREGNRE
jgi:acyl carrier protein